MDQGNNPGRMHGPGPIERASVGLFSEDFELGIPRASPA